MRLSKEYADFSEFMKVVIPFLRTNMEKFGLTEEVIVKIEKMQTDYDAIYESYVNPNSHTPIVTANMAEIYKSSDKYIRSTIRAIAANPEIVLSAEERILMGLPASTERGHSVIPTVIGLIVLYSRGVLSLTFDVNDTTPELQNNRGLIEGATNALWEYTLLDKESNVVLTNSISTGGARILLEFLENQIGFSIQITCKYTNPAGQGPKSEIFETIIT